MTFRTIAATLAAVLVAALSATVVCGPTAVRPASAATPRRSVATAKASITFDVTTGRVIDATDARSPLAVASTIKLFTALVVRDELSLDDQVTVTRQAADTAPLKLTMEPGTRWRAGDLLHAMLIASLNDTAVALAIASGHGSLAGFDREVVAQIRRLRLADRPRISDPSGLDGTEGIEGGNMISARDLAIVTRAFLSDSTLAAIVRMPLYRFQGGDGRPHVVYSHNAFLTMYPGAIGVKTGYTDRAGHCLVAAATREGRTLATVVIDSPDPVGVATAHLDAAFAAGSDTPGTGDILPDPVVEPPPTSATSSTERARVAASPKAVPAGPGTSRPVILVIVGLVASATVVVGVRRRAASSARRSRS